MTTRKRFKEYASPSPLAESSLFSKGFAIGQQARFTSTKAQLKSILQKVQTAARSAKNAEEAETKLNYISEAIIQLSEALETDAELKTNIMNVSVAITLLANDLSQPKKK